MPDVVLPQPAIVPNSLRAKPPLQHPPGSVPKSTMPAAWVQMKACSLSEPIDFTLLHPATWPASLMSSPTAVGPPSEPMSVMAYEPSIRGVHSTAWFTVVPDFRVAIDAYPTIEPASLIPRPKLEPPLRAPRSVIAYVPAPCTLHTTAWVTPHAVAACPEL